jgi:hypothetical protein
VLFPDGEKLWDPVPRRIDAELEDEGLLGVWWRLSPGVGR